MGVVTDHRSLTTEGLIYESSIVYVSGSTAYWCGHATDANSTRQNVASRVHVSISDMNAFRAFEHSADSRFGVHVPTFRTSAGRVYAGLTSASLRPAHSALYTNCLMILPHVCAETSRFSPRLRTPPAAVMPFMFKSSTTIVPCCRTSSTVTPAASSSRASLPHSSAIHPQQQNVLAPEHIHDSRVHPRFGVVRSSMLQVLG